ncbi:MAG: ABC transporter ATP-binding protein [Candidatus Dormibacteraeota bacterium]|nr:ABC transporter ATP-binding protein [Candidatus Dormibacteraeota bacterium]
MIRTEREASAAAVLQAEGIALRHRNGRGIGPLTLQADAGECVGLMGPNGAGKTTLLRLLATLEHSRSGSLRWFGGLGPVQARRHIGFAPDTVVEEGSLTARQATHFWARQWLPRSTATAHVERALRAFELDDVADERVSHFSFGMRRRLGLSQAFVHDPSLVLLDEPTAGLDPAGVLALRTLLRQRRLVGQTAVVASNDCEFVAAVCDRVVFLVDGALVRDATPATLLGSLGSHRRAELELADPCDTRSLQVIAGVVVLGAKGCALSLEVDDSVALAAAVAVADRPGGNLRSLRVHSPDLADAFWQVTGTALREQEKAR